MGQFGSEAPEVHFYSRRWLLPTDGLGNSVPKQPYQDPEEGGRQTPWPRSMLSSVSGRFAHGSPHPFPSHVPTPTAFPGITF